MLILSQQIESFERCEHGLHFDKKRLSIFVIAQGIPWEILTQKGANICVERHLPIEKIFHVINSVEETQILRQFSIDVYCAFWEACV